MIFKFNQYVIDINIDKTRSFYQVAENIADGCDCPGCRNFEKAVSHLPQEIVEIFNKMGIDMKKRSPFWRPFFINTMVIKN